MEANAHSEIAKKAVMIYSELYPLQSEQDKKLTVRFIYGSKEEDNIFTFQRLSNWHFFDPGNRLGKTRWGVHRSNQKRVDLLINKIVESAACNLRDTYEHAGRLAHHIQDMSAPPHVIPIYHTSGDPFDIYATGEIANINLSSEQLIAAKGEQMDLNSTVLRKLLKDAAEKTFDRVDKGPVIFGGKEIAKNWSGFWRKYELISTKCRIVPKKGFGCYGMDKFGIATGPFTTAVYNSFYKEQIASAIEDSLRLLVLLGKKLIDKQ
ncbi:MAG: hypothetical protein C0402_11525 [Thermodesulfovibrio sp.]|nr:hypothetical protein [Thermodesulfovibrio sp.]